MTLGANAFAQETSGAPPPLPPAPPTTGTAPAPPPAPPPPPDGGQHHWEHRWGGPGQGDPSGAGPMPMPMPMGPGPVGPMGPMGPMHYSPSGQPKVALTFDANGKSAVLERRVQTTEMNGRIVFLLPQRAEVETWEQVCVAPCTALVDASQTYRIGKENKVTQSGTFTLPANQHEVKLDVQPGNVWWHRIGTNLIGTGTAATIVGAALISTASTWDKHSSEVDVRRGGIITGAIGLVLLAAGIPMAIMTQTHVQTNGTKMAKAPPPPKLQLAPNGFLF